MLWLRWRGMLRKEVGYKRRGGTGWPVRKEVRVGGRERRLGEEKRRCGRRSLDP
jgi:hypothetical protein